MIDHVALNVSDHAASKSFYEQSLAPLGYGVVMDFEGYGTGFGAEGKPSLWIVRRDPVGGAAHVALVASGRPAVDAFHAAALAAGGQDNGSPGLRPDYHEHYYGAFVLDPDGNNVEAVCHKPQ